MELVAELRDELGDELAPRSSAMSGAELELRDALLALDGPGVRAVLCAELPKTLDQFHASYGAVPDGLPLSAAERAVGLLPSEVWRELFHRTLTEDIHPRFHRREVAMPVRHW